MNKLETIKSLPSQNQILQLENQALQSELVSLMSELKMALQQIQLMQSEKKKVNGRLLLLEARTQQLDRQTPAQRQALIQKIKESQQPKKE